MRLSTKAKVVGGITILMFILISIGFISYSGISNIIKNKHKVDSKNNLNQYFSDVIIAHLKWKNTIANILISKQDASVETDPTQCILGKWYHKFIESEDFEKLSSNEKKILRSLHDPHDSLHDSAIEIKNNLSDFNSMIEIYIN